MAPIGWATPDEREFLKSFIPEYEACQVRRRYKTFWQEINSRFLTRFPVIEKLFPGRKITDLSPEQKEMVTAGVMKQQQRIKEWYRWQLNPRSRNTGTVISKKDLHTIYSGRSRANKPYEIFAKIYREEVKAEKEARCTSQGISGRQTLNVWQEVSMSLYEAASDEQKEAVKKAMSQRVCVEEPHSGTPKDYLRNLKKLPSLLDAAISPAVLSAGVLAFVTIVGPDPEQNGKIVCKSLQFGDKCDTPVFAQLWDGHDALYVEELARFARRYEFTPDVCAARSLSLPHRIINEPTSESKDNSLSSSPVQVQAAATPELNQSPNQTQPPTTGTTFLGLNAQQTTSGPPEGQARPLQDSTYPIPSDPAPNNNCPYGSVLETSLGVKIAPVGLSNAGLLFLSPSRMGINSPNDPPNSPHDSFSGLLSPSDELSADFDYSSLDGFHGWTLSDDTLEAMDRAIELSESGTTRHALPALSLFAGSDGTLAEATGNSQPPGDVFLNGSGSLSDSAAPPPSADSPPLSSSPSPPDHSGNAATFPSLPSPLPVPSPLSYPSSAVSALVSDRSGPPIPTFPSYTSPSSGSQASLTDSSLSPKPSAPSTGISLSRPDLGSITHKDRGSGVGAVLPSDQSAPLPSQPAPQTSLRLAQPSQTSSSLDRISHPPAQSLQSAEPIPVVQLLLVNQPGKTSESAQVGKPGPSVQLAPVTQPLPTEPKPPSPVSHGLPASSCSPVPSPAGNSALPSTPLATDETPEVRRSSRGFVPSKRNERLQLIGSNVPGSVADYGAPTLAWFSSAVDFLRSFEFGEEWKSLVDGWEALEGSMGHGKTGKGTLSASGRPEEWHKWTSKTWQGARRYDLIPQLESAAEFGMALTKWWLSLQPPFRASAGPLPLPLFVSPDSSDVSDAWASLRKSGQNGIVSVLLLLAWWMNAAKTTTSEWEDDSRPAWHRMVSDVSGVINAMIATATQATAQGGKRKRDKENVPPPKRASKR